MYSVKLKFQENNEKKEWYRKDYKKILDAIHWDTSYRSH